MRSLQLAVNSWLVALGSSQIQAHFGVDPHLHLCVTSSLSGPHLAMENFFHTAQPLYSGVAYLHFRVTSSLSRLHLAMNNSFHTAQPRP